MLILVVLALLCVGGIAILPRKTWLKIACLVWLLLVTPLFGLIPLFCLVNTGAKGGFLCRLEGALLADLWTSFHVDVQLGMDEWPPIAERHWFLIISIVLGIAAGAAVYCTRSWLRSRDRTLAR